VEDLPGGDHPQPHGWLHPGRSSRAALTPMSWPHRNRLAPAHPRRQRITTPVTPPRPTTAGRRFWKRTGADSPGGPRTVLRCNLRKSLTSGITRRDNPCLGYHFMITLPASVASPSSLRQPLHPLSPNPAAAGGYISDSRPSSETPPPLSPVSPAQL